MPLTRCPYVMMSGEKCNAPVEVRTGKTSGKDYYHCNVSIVGHPNVQHGYICGVGEDGPKYPKTEEKRVSEEQQYKAQKAAAANPAAALDQSVLEGRLQGMQVDLADIKELLRVLVARSNTATDKSWEPVPQWSTAAPVPPNPLLPQKRQKTREEEEFEEYLRQKEQVEMMPPAKRQRTRKEEFEEYLRLKEQQESMST